MNINHFIYDTYFYNTVDSDHNNIIIINKNVNVETIRHNKHLNVNRYL